MKAKKEHKQVRDKVGRYANQPGHRVPQTRREFLASGLLSAGVSVLGPSLLGMVSRSAHAQALGCNNLADLPCYINLQLAGGPALFANHLAHGAEGNPLPSYAILGVGNGPSIAYHFANNAPFFAPDGARAGSGFLRGLKNRLGTALFNEIVGGTTSGTAGKAVFVAVACKSVDDTLTNKHDLTPLLIRAGLGGGALPYMLYQTRTGNDVNLGVNRFKGAFFDAPAYLMGNSVAAIESSLGFKGALVNDLKTETHTALQLQEELIGAINNLTQVQVDAMLNAPGSRESRRTFLELARCGSAKNLDILKVQKGVKVDIYQEPALAAIWAKTFTGFAGGFDAAYKNDVAGLLGVNVSSAIKGLSGACTAVLGGYDYHAGQTDTRAAQDDKDQYAGEIVANILATAKALGKRVFIYISADGSVSSPNNAGASANQPWQGDYSERGMNYIIAYDPAATITAKPYISPSYKDASFQLNHFSRNASEDLVAGSANPISNTDAQDLAAAAVFTNYLSFAKRKDLLNLGPFAQVRKRLADALPTGEGDIFNFFSRIAG